MRGHDASALLGVPVVTRGIRLGDVEDVILDGSEPRVIGLDVLCGDGTNRFLPFATARVSTNGVEIESVLTLLDERALEFYRGRGRSLAAEPELGDARVHPDGALVVPLAARR